MKIPLGAFVRFFYIVCMAIFIVSLIAIFVMRAKPPY